MFISKGNAGPTARVSVLAPNQQQLDKMTVRNLDSYMETVSKPSKILENLVEKHCVHHAQALSALQNEMTDVNITTEAKVQHEVNILNSYMEEQTARLEGLCTRIQLPTVDKSEFDETLQIAKDITCDKKQHIAKFIQKVVKTERNRMEQLKKILKKYYELMQEIHYVSLFDLQKLFEHKIMAVNQLTLNNLRSYEDIKLHLTQLAHKHLLYLFGHLHLLKTTWVERQREINEITIMEYMGQMEVLQPQFLSGNEGRNLLEQFKDERCKLKRLMLEWSDHIEYPPRMKMNCSEELQQVLQNLDNAAKKLMISYNTAVQEAIVTFSSWLKDLRQKLIAKNIYDTSQVKCWEDSHEKLVKQSETLLENEVKGIKTHWNNIMKEYDNELQEPLQLLAEGSSVWLNHVQRTCQAKVLINKMLEQENEKGNTIIESKEVELNITIDNLRQEWLEEMLEKVLAEVFDILSDIKELNNSNHLRKTEMLEKYRDVTDTELQILRAEIQMFLATYSGKRFTTELFNEQDVLEIPNTIQREMELCKIYLVGAQAWKARLEDVMSSYLAICEAELKTEVEKWISDRTDDMKKIYEFNVMVLGTRYDRIKKMVHDIRLAEIQVHQQRLQIHHQGMQEHLSILQQNHIELEEKIRNMTAKLEGTFLTMETEAESVKTIGNADNLLNQVNRNLNKFLEDLKFMKQEYQELCKNNVAWLRQSNLNVSKAIKLFSDGGNFSINEANYFLKTLNELSQMIDQEESNIGELSMSRENLIIQEIQGKFGKLKNRLEVILEDLQFSHNVQKILGKLQKEIWKTVRNMKLQGKELGKSVIFASSAIGQPELSGDLWWHQLFMDISARFQSLIASTIEDGLFIFHEEDTLQVAPKVAPVTKSYVDYTSMLIPPPHGTEPFLVKINKLLWDCFNILQETAVNFYTIEETRPVVKWNDLQPNYDCFMMDMLAIFKCYHMQCVQIWLQQVLEFLHTLITLKNIASGHVEKSQSLFQENEINKLQEKKQAYLSAFEDIQKNHNLQRSVLDAKLHPHYGFHGNRHILESLTHKMLELSTIHTEDLAACAAEYLEQLKQTFKEYEDGLITIGEVMVSIFDLLFYHGVSEAVVIQAQELCSRLQDSNLVLSSNDDDKEPYKGSQTECIKITIPRELDFIPDMGLDVECGGPHKKNIKQCVEEILHVTAQLSGILSDQERTGFMDIEYFTTKIMHEYKSMYQDIVTKINIQVDAYKDNIQSWKAKWENNIQEIEKLYTLRYV